MNSLPSINSLSSRIHQKHVKEPTLKFVLFHTHLFVAQSHRHPTWPSRYEQSRKDEHFILVKTNAFGLCHSVLFMHFLLASSCLLILFSVSGTISKSLLHHPYHHVVMVYSALSGLPFPFIFISPA